jgi:hypothetical protein
MNEFSTFLSLKSLNKSKLRMQISQSKTQLLATATFRKILARITYKYTSLLVRPAPVPLPLPFPSTTAPRSKLRAFSNR